MPRGPPLTEVEKGKILAYRESGDSFVAIATKVGRSDRVVRNFLHHPESYGTKKHPGPTSTLGSTALRQLIRTAKAGKSSSSQLVEDLSLSISPRRVRQILQADPNLQWVKRIKTPRLTPKHREKRLEWARGKARWNIEWNSVLFSDEKKFNLDGPDGCQYYWHDLRRDEEQFFSRQNGGGSVMVWGGMSANGLTDLAFLNGTQNSRKYIETLSEYLIPFIDIQYGSNFIFMQDGASIHRSKETMSWLQHDQSHAPIEVMDWPALSPDLNPIENVWGMLARMVYANGRQFATKIELVEAIKASWGNIKISYLKKLIESMPRRCTDVLECKGSKTKH